MKTYPASRLRVETTSYEAAHGRKPRGTGSWGFDIAGTVFWAKPGQPYSQAKREAQAEAGRRGETSCQVAS